MKTRNDLKALATVTALLLILSGGESFAGASPQDQLTSNMGATQAQEPQLAPSPFDKTWFRTPQSDEFVKGSAYVRFNPDASPTLRASRRR